MSRKGDQPNHLNHWDDPRSSSPCVNSPGHTLPVTVTNDVNGKRALGDSFMSMTKQIADVDRNITVMQFPIGWPVDAGVSWFFQYLVGGLLTAIALSMGSTFCFDALQS
jgi:hypothetical protein